MPIKYVIIEWNIKKEGKKEFEKGKVYLFMN